MKNTQIINKAMLRNLSLFGILITMLTLSGTKAVAEEIRIPGLTYPLESVTIGLPEAGRIEQVFILEGDFIESGQKLLNLYKRIDELEVERRKLLVENDFEEKFTRQRLDIVEKQYLAAKKLLRQSAISRDEFEQKEMEFLQLKTEVNRLQTSGQMEEIELRMATEKLERKVLYAPISGFVVKIFKKKGESIQSYEDLVQIVDTRVGEFIGNTEESIASRLKTGQKIELRFRSESGIIKRSGTISYISATIDAASGLLKVKAEFDNADGAIRLGKSAEIVL